jgi:uridylate kinase
MEHARNIVIKYGGSLLFENGAIRTERVDAVCDIVRERVARGHRVGLVVGGGWTARHYIAALAAGYPVADKDLVAVLATRLNAMLFISRLADLAAPYPPSSYEELARAAKGGAVVVSGGLQPGQSTNAVAALLCEAMGASVLVNASNVSYVYDRDPRTNPDAVPLSDLTYEELTGIIAGNGASAGQYALFDMVAASIVARSKIVLHFVDGSMPQTIRDVLEGKKAGTTVQGKI